MSYRSVGRPRVGSFAPDVVLHDVFGDIWRLDRQRGKYVVLIFHRHIH
ncbi:MAG: hypothetical protein ACKVK3_04785 [Acidimicrobiales bacterium]|jgi:peroxiredoxin